MTLLSARDVVANPTATSALRGAWLEVRDGESVALLGEQGSGTTTMLQCLAGLVRPVAGRVLLDDVDLASLRPQVLAALRVRDLGVVFPGGDMLPELSLVENVEIPLLRTGVAPDRARARARELLDRLLVGAGASRRPGDVSAGQRQRAAVARALVHSPRVVLADAPTAPLDPPQSYALMDLLVATAKDLGSALVVATHDPELAARTDRVVTLRAGRLVSAGPVAALQAG